MATSPSILIAGIGNIFLGDDAFGSEVARRLESCSWPEGVRANDFGIRGLDLAYAMLDGHDLTVLIDATPRGSAPGTLYVIEPDLSALDDARLNATLLDAHTLDPLKILGVARVMGGGWKRLVLVGCEPADLGGEEGRLGLSDPVRAAVDEAVDLVSRLVSEFLECRTLQTVDDFQSTTPDAAIGAAQEGGRTPDSERNLRKEPHHGG